LRAPWSWPVPPSGPMIPPSTPWRSTHWRLGPRSARCSWAGCCRACAWPCS
jgi:hypothetical protein